MSCRIIVSVGFSDFFFLQRCYWLHLPLRVPGTKSDLKEAQGRVFQGLRVGFADEAIGYDVFATYIFTEEDGKYFSDVRK